VALEQRVEIDHRVPTVVLGGLSSRGWGEIESQTELAEQGKKLS
jgi:hypothetical protein